MLVLSRHQYEEVYIGNDVSVEDARQMLYRELQRYSIGISDIPDDVADCAAHLLSSVMRRVTVSVVDIRGDKCRLGIEAPKSLTVHRREVYEAIKRNTQRANMAIPDEQLPMDGFEEPTL